MQLKKLITCCTLCAVMAICAVVPAAQAVITNQEETNAIIPSFTKPEDGTGYSYIYKGDINYDKIISLTDVVNLQRFCARTYDMHPYTYVAADVNNDYYINTQDVIYMQKSLADLIDNSGLGSAVMVSIIHPTLYVELYHTEVPTYADPLEYL